MIAVLNEKVQGVTVEAIQNHLGVEFERFKAQLYAEQMQQMQQALQMQAQQQQQQPNRPLNQVGGDNMNYVTSFSAEDNAHHIYHLDAMQAGVATATANVIEDDIEDDWENLELDA